MNPSNRRPIQAIEPAVLDALLALSFDWKELANRLTGCGRVLPGSNPGSAEHCRIVYRMASAACLAEGPYADGITTTLNLRHGAIICRTAHMCMPALCSLISQLSHEPLGHLGGFVWAMATNPREGAANLVEHLLRCRVLDYYLTSGDHK